MARPGSVLTVISAGTVTTGGVVSAIAVMMKACVTGGAGLKLPLPPWFAVIEQVPAVRMIALDPEMLHTPPEFEVNETPKPDDAVAVRGTDWFSVAVAISAGSVKVMVWLVKVATYVERTTT